MEMTPIGYFHTRKKKPYEAARQSTVDVSEEIGEIRLQPGQLFEQALEDLDGISHLWVISHFHLNDQWKPKVLPPRGSDKKIGVFATRSPYRPNPLGLSCVKLVEVRGLVVKVRDFDLLDGTPILDLKPYIPYADSIPEAQTGWIQEIENHRFDLSWSDSAAMEFAELERLGLSELRNTCIQQLSFEPFNSKKKRVARISEDRAILSYRTWRVEFHVQDQHIHVIRIYSGYSTEDLDSRLDPYADKNLHRQFIQWQIQPKGEL